MERRLLSGALEGSPLDYLTYKKDRLPDLCRKEADLMADCRQAGLSYARRLEELGCTLSSRQVWMVGGYPVPFRPRVGSEYHSLLEFAVHKDGKPVSLFLEECGRAMPVVLTVSLSEAHRNSSGLSIAFTEPGNWDFHQLDHCVSLLETQGPAPVEEAAVTVLRLPSWILMTGVLGACLSIALGLAAAVQGGHPALLIPFLLLCVLSVLLLLAYGNWRILLWSDSFQLRTLFRRKYAFSYDAVRVKSLSRDRICLQAPHKTFCILPIVDGLREFLGHLSPAQPEL